MVTDGLQVAIPDPESLPVNETVTFVLFHPFALGAGLTVAIVVGAPLSILKPDCVLDAVLPATSWQVPVAD